MLLKRSCNCCQTEYLVPELASTDMLLNVSRDIILDEENNFLDRILCLI
jgi:hypothetical protein